MRFLVRKLTVTADRRRVAAALMEMVVSAMPLRPRAAVLRWVQRLCA